MQKKAISIKLDAELLAQIDEYANSRRISRTEAITSMLKNTKITMFPYGAEILKELHLLSAWSKSGRNSYAEQIDVRRIIKKLWQLLNLTIEKSQQQSEV